MRRQIAYALRLGLFALGVLLLLWMAVSFSICFTLVLSAVGHDSGLHSTGGAVELWLTEGEALPPFDMRVGRERHAATGVSSLLIPSWNRQPPISGVSWLSIPLWLLAAICFAWPVTSFIIARRRHKRGFEVRFTNDQTRNLSETQNQK